MKKPFSIVFLALLGYAGFQCSNAPVEFKEKPAEIVRSNFVVPAEEDIFIAANKLNSNIRDGLISMADARPELNRLRLLAGEYYYNHGGTDHKRSAWIFPVKGYNANSIGGKEGSGYIDEGYFFFDGNRHKGHPAHDIFIQDRNQDCVDDATGKPVYILSVSGGVVFAAETQWDTLSSLRGGKYLWIYYPAEKSLFYYAHNDSLLVAPGDIVKPGDKIAVMGRSGINAWKKRSPTHLHFSYFIFQDGIPRPVNIYPELLKSKTL